MLAFGLGTVPGLVVVGIAGHAAGRTFSRGVGFAAPLIMLGNAVLLAAMLAEGPVAAAPGTDGAAAGPAAQPRPAPGAAAGLTKPAPRQAKTRFACGSK